MGFSAPQKWCGCVFEKGEYEKTSEGKGRAGGIYMHISMINMCTYIYIHIF